MTQPKSNSFPKGYSKSGGGGSTTENSGSDCIRISLERLYLWAKIKCRIGQINPEHIIEPDRDLG
jgi:hypothetical protein